MIYEHKELIHDYLQIKSHTKRIEKRMFRAKKEFYAQNFCGKTDFYDPLGVKYVGYRIESRVSAHVDYLDACELNIKINKRRHYYFKQYISKLDPHTYASLKRRYHYSTYIDDVQELGHDEEVLEEIFEIEEAISHEFNTFLHIKKEKYFYSPYRYTRNKKSEKTLGAVAELIGL